MLVLAQTGRERLLIDDGDADAAERYISIGDPIVVVKELRGPDAAATALLELAAADAIADIDDDPITLERVVPHLTHADFDPSVIDALVALERGDDEPRSDSPDERFVQDHLLIEHLREPYVDFRALASL